MRLKVSKSKNSASLYVIKSVYNSKTQSNSSVIVEKLGTEAELKEKLNGQDPYKWAKAYIAELNEKAKEGDVVVIRYEGPKGGPGMREMCKSMKYIYGAGLSTKTALITDGRFSGTNNGCFVGHISPEAAEGGPISIVEDGDEILIDVDKNLLELHVPEEVIKNRLAEWKPIGKEIPRGYLRLYAKMATSAEKGGVLKY